jgi:hypothetical protein
VTHPEQSGYPKRFCPFVIGVACSSLCLRIEDDYRSCRFLNGRTPAEIDADLERSKRDRQETI